MQSIKDFFVGFSNSILQNMSKEGQKEISHVIGEGIAEGIEKSGKELFSIGISITLIGIGFFLIIWGIATTVDIIFAMKGFGYILIGIFAILIGLVYKKHF